MFRFLKNVIFWIVFLLLAAGSYLFFQGNSFQQGALKAQVAVQTPMDIPPLHATLVQVTQDGNRRILECTSTGCTPKNPPSSVGTNPLSDGTNWYRYAERSKANAVTASVLEKVDNEGNVQTITEENPLVKPRDMMISTDGTKIAYFLDNIHDESDFTELWAYDSVDGGSKVIAEKLHRPDIASRVRWNASSRVVWFLQDAQTKQLTVAPLTGSGAVPAFLGVNWQDHAGVADTGVMDITDDASLVAFAEKSLPEFSRLFVARGNEAPIQKTIKGDIVFIRWMKNGGLLYAVQDGKNLSFWMASKEKEWPITRMSAIFESAHSTGASDFAAFVASPREGELHLYILQVATGLMKDQTIVPGIQGRTYVVQTREESNAARIEGASTSSQSDGALVALVEEHIKDIAQESVSHASRILITDRPNTLFVDYVGAEGAEKRMLIEVKDVVNPDWKVVASYTTINGIWKRSDTSGDQDPAVVRLYEWEDSLSQWILKQTF